MLMRSGHARFSRGLTLTLRSGQVKRKRERGGGGGERESCTGAIYVNALRSQSTMSYEKRARTARFRNELSLRRIP